MVRWFSAFDRKVFWAFLVRSWRGCVSVLHSATTICLVGALALIVAVSGREAERTGDLVQVFLPVTALVCSAANGQGVQYFGRYLLLEAGIKLPKNLLGDLPINQRPGGGTAGFPSGHTAAATFGAVGLVQTCLKHSKTAQAVAILAAGFTGGSRIDADKHTVWQVLAGAIWGWAVYVLVWRSFDRGVAHVARKIGFAARRSFDRGRAALAQNKP